MLIQPDNQIEPEQPAPRPAEPSPRPDWLEPIRELPDTSAVEAARARRRRRKGVAPHEAGERAEFFTELARLGTPLFDFFLACLLVGIVLAVAIALDLPALYLLTALLLPFMSPVVGLALGAAAGWLGTFLRSLVALVLGGLLTAAASALAGLLVGAQPVGAQAVLHSNLTWSDLLVTALGAAVTMVLVVRSPRAGPLVSSVALAYELYLPLGVAGYGLLSGVTGLWEGGLMVFAAHSAVAVMVGALTLVGLRVRPLRLLDALVAIVLLALVVTGTAGVLQVGPALVAPLPSPTPVILPSDTPLPTRTSTPTPTATSTPVPPTATIPFTATLRPTLTSSATLVPSPTPVWGIVNAGDYKGVIIRAEASGTSGTVTSLLNGALLQILPEVVNRGGVIWWHVRTPDGLEGWAQAILIATATPVPQ